MFALCLGFGEVWLFLFGVLRQGVLRCCVLRSASLLCDAVCFCGAACCVARCVVAWCGVCSTLPALLLTFFLFFPPFHRRKPRCLVRSTRRLSARSSLDDASWHSFEQVRVVCCAVVFCSFDLRWIAWCALCTLCRVAFVWCTVLWCASLCFFCVVGRGALRCCVRVLVSVCWCRGVFCSVLFV